MIFWALLLVNTARTTNLILRMFSWQHQFENHTKRIHGFGSCNVQRWNFAIRWEGTISIGWTSWVSVSTWWRLAIWRSSNRKCSRTATIYWNISQGISTNLRISNWDQNFWFVGFFSGNPVKKMTNILNSSSKQKLSGYTHANDLEIRQRKPRILWPLFAWMMIASQIILFVKGGAWTNR